MKIKDAFVIIILLSITERLVAQPNWSSIKSSASLSVSIPSEFGTPYLQPLAVGGWEDGLFISRDGLNLYCLYTPIDLFSWQFIGAADNSNFTPYYRGPSFGMDLITTPLSGPTEWLHSDILISQRTTTAMQFPAWQLSNLANPIWSEGAPQINSISGSTADLFVYASNNVHPTYKTDIVLLKNVALNPSVQGTMLPFPVNTPDTREDNPHIERLSSQNLVLFWDSDDRSGGVGQLDIWFSTSTDNGVTWAVPTQVSTINTTLGEQQPHLYKDGLDWFLYYTGTNTVTEKAEIYRAKLGASGDWNSWQNIESVIGAGNTLGVGEPTLTQNGDLSFVVIYSDNVNGTSTDKYDADPWFLPKLTTVSVEDNFEATPSFEFYPNPAKTELIVKVHSNDHYEITISNLLGQILIKDQNPSRVDISLLTTDIYIMTFIQGQNIYQQKFIKE
jgi:hypothetical protein